ncbi:hypothetical protein FRC00_005163 [Tulasnella sp. 408]|nr:hypothetical protein FRC00_005163 [Tulasnella sp. 408]
MTQVATPFFPQSPLSPLDDGFDSPPLFDGRKLKLTIYQDPTCPWCYIGEREMQWAIQILKEQELDVKVELEFRPFLLDPELPVDRPVNKREHYYQRFGNKATLWEKFVTARGAALGIDFKFGGPARSSLMCQRLIMKAGEIGGGEAQKALYEEISRRVLEQEKDVGCLRNLSESAAACGLMCAERAIAFLTSDQLQDEVEQEIALARQKGITGVPFAVINDKYAVCGGLPKEKYLDQDEAQFIHGFRAKQGED